MANSMNVHDGKFVFGTAGEYINFFDYPCDVEGARMLFLGASGAGKTNFLLLLVEWLTDRNIPVLFIDVNGGEEGGEVVSHLNEWSSDRNVGDLSYYVSFRREFGVGSEILNFLRAYIDWSQSSRTYHFLVIDDVDYLAAKKPMFEWQKEASIVMAHLLYNARKWGVNIASASNAASRVSPYWIEQQNVRFIGMMSSKHDWVVQKLYLPKHFSMETLINLSVGEVYISSKCVSPGAIMLRKSALAEAGYTPLPEFWDVAE